MLSFLLSALVPPPVALLCASVHISLLVCAGVEVFIISGRLGSGIEFLHLCPCSLSPLSDTLYLPSFTSLTLSTCNTYPPSFPSSTFSPSSQITTPIYPHTHTHTNTVAKELCPRHPSCNWCVCFIDVLTVFPVMSVLFGFISFLFLSSLLFPSSPSDSNPYFSLSLNPLASFFSCLCWNTHYIFCYVF